MSDLRESLGLLAFAFLLTLPGLYFVYVVEAAREIPVVEETETDTDTDIFGTSRP